MNISPDTQKILELLAQVIVADGHIHSSEIDALAEAAKSIGLTDQQGALLKEAEIKHWFISHTEEISAFHDTDNSDIQLTRLILSLSNWPEKQKVVDALGAISRADHEEHMEEKLLISIVRAYWQFEGLDAPGATIGS
ncbi:MAG: hypothetical protein HKN36_02955 [Hellea sp.]|nr:hypothetical protein [Hellea sp.]